MSAPAKRSDVKIGVVLYRARDHRDVVRVRQIHRKDRQLLAESCRDFHLVIINFSELRFWRLGACDQPTPAATGAA